MKKTILFLLLGAVIPNLLNASNKPEQQQAIQRMEKAVAKTNLFELPSFEMKAVLQILDHKGSLTEGSYDLMWNGPDQWREEIKFPNYHEIQLGGKGTIGVQRSTDYTPLVLYYLRSALGFSSTVGQVAATVSLVRPSIRAGDTVKRTRERTTRGDKLTCFEIEEEHKLWAYEACVNDTTDTLVRDASTFLDENLQPVGDKVFPRSLSYLQFGKTIAKVNIGEIKTPIQFPQDAFTPSAGFTSQTGCMNPVPANIVKRRAPEYPQNARMKHIQGTVFFDEWVGADGVPKNLKVLETPSSDLAEAGMEAIRQWRYEPGQCGDQPVPVETKAQVNFQLSQ